MSAHCVLTKINLDKTLKDLEKFIAIFEIKFQFGKGKKLRKDIYGHISLRTKW